MDLTPRPVRERRRRRWLPALALVAVLGAAGALLFQGLGDATLYFRNVDEAVAERDSLGDRRFRLQGTVVPGSVRDEAGGVAFQVAWDGAVADVRHAGSPPELFQDGIPVVLEGRWEGEAYASDTIRVKHSEEYREDNGDRLAEAGARS